MTRERAMIIDADTDSYPHLHHTDSLPSYIQHDKGIHEAAREANSAL
jgi:hypothetical protein